MKQLHLSKKFILEHRQDLTYEENQIVLESHMILKHKWDEQIKGRTVAGGNKQCSYIPK